MTNTATFDSIDMTTQSFPDYNNNPGTVNEFKLSDNPDNIGYYIKQKLQYFMKHKYEHVPHFLQDIIKESINSNTLINPDGTYDNNSNINHIVPYVKYEKPSQIYYNIVYFVPINNQNTLYQNRSGSGFNIIISATDEHSGDYSILENSIRFLTNTSQSVNYYQYNSTNSITEYPNGHSTDAYRFQYNSDSNDHFYEIPYCSYNNDVPLTHPSNLKNSQGQYSHLQHMRSRKEIGLIIGFCFGVGLPLLFLIYLIVSTK